MNYGEYLKCENSYCENQIDKINIDKKLIELKQKIIKTKSLKKQEKYIKEFNNLKIIKNHLICMINNCKFNLIYNLKKSFDLYKLIIKKEKKIPTIIKKIINESEIFLLNQNILIKNLEN